MVILLIEDEPISALSVLLELQASGHEVIGPATHFDEALQLAHRHDLDLALIDIDLKDDGDGIELARRFAELAIPAVFVSGQGALARAHSDLALGYISKPFNPADVPGSIAAIDTLLGGSVPHERVVPGALQLFPRARQETLQDA
jgi:DNA-binding response OmpR family regulator